MKHLNEKGFAISTILYGSLTVILILLMGIFVIIRTTKNLNDNFTEDIVKKLNECINDEIVLEQCYSTSTVCDTKAYYSCMGVTEDEVPLPTTLPTIKNKLVSDTGTLVTGLYLDDYEPNKYIYRGDNPANYVVYAGYTWRIVSIEADNSVKIMIDTTSSNLTIDWDGGDNPGNEWHSSKLNNYLNTTFFNSVVTDLDKITQKGWNVGTIFFDAVEDFETMLEQEKKAQFTGNKSTVGLITATEYLRASTSSSCITNPFAACSSWLPTNMWTINGYVGSAPGKQATHVSAGGLLDGKSVTSSIKAYPVVYINSAVRISSGDGTYSTPYILN